MLCHRLWLKAPVFFLQFICLILFSLKKISMPGWGIGLLLFCFLLFLTELAEYKSKKCYGKNALYLFPVFFLAVLLLLSFPVKDTPVQWNGIKNMAKAFQEKIYSLIVDADYFFSGGTNDYGLSFTGYHPDSELGGKLLSSDRSQISVEGLPTKSPLYLAGSIKNVYTGQGWQADTGKKPYEEEEYQLQYKEWETALERSVFTQQEKWELIHYASCNIKYEGVKTDSLFLPSLTRSLVLPGKARLAKKKGDSLSLSKAKGVGFSYSLNFLEVNYLDERVEKLLRQQAWALPPVSDSLLEKRRAYIYEQYTKLPEELPRRVYELAEEITKASDTEYDRLKAIETYLRGFTYTTDPKACPKGREFTDYFLFDSKSGYCTYFATALAVLGRCEGIPTRYVEGFLTKDTCNGGRRVHELSSKSAHAWAEAYIDGIGWIPFEATPGYREAIDRVWARQQTGSVSAPLDLTKEMESNILQEEEAVQADASDFSEKGRQIFNYVLWGLLVCLLFAFISGLFFFLRREFRRKFYRSLPENQKLEFHMKKLFLFGKLYGYLLDSGETLSAYVIRAEGVLNTDAASAKEICRLYQEVRFGGRTVTEKEVEKMERYAQSLEKQYLEGCGYLEKLFYYIR